MKRLLGFLAVAMLGMVLAGCPLDSSSSSGHGILPLNFTAFVKDQLSNTSDTRAPAPVNPYAFKFTDKNHPHAYDDVTQ